MTNARTKNRWIALGALVVAGGALAFIAFGNLGQNLVYYWSPAELKQHEKTAVGLTVRLGGVVEKNSVHWNPERTELTFRVADRAATGAVDVPVLARETPPQMFREGIGVVVEGAIDNQGTFISNRLMVNHSNEYRPPAPGQAPSGWDKTLAASTSSTKAK
jgi:cytochrome c-type biogenesis protein CcmE